MPVKAQQTVPSWRICLRSHLCFAMSGRGRSKEQALRVAVFSTKPYDRRFLDAGNSAHGHDLVFFESRHTRDTAHLTANLPALCAFVNDDLNATVLEMLWSQGTRLIALRSAGFNNVDLDAADALDLVVVRVPAYSPYAVAEHTVGLVLALNWKLPRAHNRVREGNFALEGCSVSTSMARPPASSVPAKSGQSWPGS